MSDPAVEGVILLERSVYFPEADALVLSDVHFGRAASSNVDAPVDEDGDVCDRLESLLAARRPETVVVAGDLLHSFSRIPRGVERSIARFVDRVEDAGASLVVTPGNHDAMLEGVFSGTTAAEHRLADGETVVCHGHEPPRASAGRYVVGHDHPALSIEGRKLPCFLYAPESYEGADVLVLPAFTRLASGMTINRASADDFQSPLVTDVDAAYPAVRDAASDETLWFPPLGESRRLL
jgi:uncharacterized protein